MSVFVQPHAGKITKTKARVICPNCDGIAELEGKAAKAAHDIWAHWMKYMFTQGKYQQSNFVISFENVARWQRQMMTEFKDLLPQEQKSDFEIADHFIAPLFREMAQALSEAQAENVGLKGRFLDHAETDSYLRMVKYAAHVKDLYRWEKEQKEAVQAENDRLKADAERTDKAFSKALKDLVLANRESKRLGNQVVLAVNKGCELQAENERLRAGIGRALKKLDNGSHGDAEDILEALHDA